MNEVAKLPLPAEVKESLVLSETRLTRDEYNNFRTCLATSLPLCFIGATPPRPCPDHPVSLAAGIAKRFGCRTPSGDRRFKRKFKRFVQLWCRRNLNPLTAADIPTFEEWLTNTPYSQARKTELERVWNSVDRKLTRREAKFVKSFVKDETYPEYKYPRSINSRVDAAKCFFGPVVDAVSERVFSLEWFIKYIPVSQRPMVLRDTLFKPGSEYQFTDFTSFEAHFTPEVMEMTQMILFKHMVGVADPSWYALYHDVLAGANVMQFKNFDVKILGTRMSGEMDTSLSNGFANLMLFLFLCKENGALSVVGFVEGDDGLFRVCPSAAAPTTKQFEDLGFTIKIGTTTELSEASFCGQVYDMNDLKVVTDPLEVLARVGFTNKKYVQASEKTRMQLLRAKGYSLAYQYNGCPILHTLGMRLLTLTRGHYVTKKVVNSLDQWEKQKLKEAMESDIPNDPIGDNTRALVEKLYNIDVAEQLRIENWISKLQFGLHKLPCIDRVHPSWVHYYDTYSTEIYHKDPVWLVKDESDLIDRLARYQNLDKFVKSVR